MCSAYYRGGCCQVDRNCDSTSCPSPATKTVENSNGATVIVPATTTADGSGPTCAVGWFSCAAKAGGGCCPTGYKCGDLCTKSGQTVEKDTPGGASTIDTTLLTWALVLGAAVAGAGTVLL
jgi:progranulin